MKKHLNWPEDDRICHLPDPIEGEACPGCCDMPNPKMYGRIHWECLFKKDHLDNHSDIWGFEWNSEGVMLKKPHHDGRCHHCGDRVPFDGMFYCGKACSALDGLK